MATQCPLSGENNRPDNLRLKAEDPGVKSQLLISTKEPIPQVEGEAEAGREILATGVNGGSEKLEDEKSGEAKQRSLSSEVLGLEREKNWDLFVGKKLLIQDLGVERERQVEERGKGSKESVKINFEVAKRKEIGERKEIEEIGFGKKVQASKEVLTEQERLIRAEQKYWRRTCKKAKRTNTGSLVVATQDSGKPPEIEGRGAYALKVRVSLTLSTKLGFLTEKETKEVENSLTNPRGSQLDAPSASAW